jgi:GAF domain-containing protein
MQWIFNLSLTGALDEAEQKHGELVQSQSLLAERADELGKANALLNKRTVQLQTAAQVSGAATFAELNSDELVQRVVELIRERFDLYYVGLYLIDDAGAGVYGEWARLRAGTGEAGRQMLALGYKIAVDTSSTVGWCMVNGETRIALDAGAIHLASSSEHVKAARLLPDTRSEMALPLRSRGRVIGALNLRSVEREAFSEEDVPVLQTLADQIAVAIDNARLFAEAQENLGELERVQRRYVREQWTRFMSSYGLPVYERTQPDIRPLSDATPPEVERVLSGREMTVKSDAGSGAGDATLVVPIRLRGETLGALGLQETQGERWWTDDEIALIEAVADQMALAIENARLLEETQRRAAQERVLSDITAQVRSSTQVDTILRTAVREIGRALRASEGVIKLGSGNDSGSHGDNEGVLDDDSADA